MSGMLFWDSVYIGKFGVRKDCNVYGLYNIGENLTAARRHTVTSFQGWLNIDEWLLDGPPRPPGIHLLSSLQSIYIIRTQLYEVFN